MNDIGLMTPDPVTGADLLDHQRTLYNSKNPTRRWLHRSRRDWIIAALRRSAPANAASAIEIGPGSGVYLPTLLDLCEHVAAVDVESQYLEAARQLAAGNDHLEVIQADIACPETLAGQSFDLVLCSEVIEHVPSEKMIDFLFGLRRLVAPNGILILSTPQRWSIPELVGRVVFHPPFIWLVRWFYREPVLNPGHINLMNRRALERLLKSSGFHIVEHHLSGVYLPGLAELFGHTAVKVQAWLESRWLGTFMSPLIWTQYYIAHSIADWPNDAR